MKKIGIIVFSFVLLVTCTFSFSLTAFAAVDPADWENAVYFGPDDTSGTYVSSWNSGNKTIVDIGPGEWPSVFQCSYTASGATMASPLVVNNDFSVPANAEFTAVWSVPKIETSLDYDNYYITMTLESEKGWFQFTFNSDGTFVHKNGGALLIPDPLFADDLNVSVQLDTNEIWVSGTLLYDISGFRVQANFRGNFYETDGYVRYVYSAPGLIAGGYQASNIVDTESSEGIIGGIGQAVQGVIGWVGRVIPLVTEYPGFIMMIAVPLFVGIVTWVTTIYKRRRG